MVTKKNICKETCKEIYSELSNKWTLTILKNMFLGCKKFNDFLEANPDLSNKVLSDQLKSLERLNFIKKVIISTTPIKAKYQLTKMRKSLNKLIYEKIIFGLNNNLFDRSYPLIKDINLEEIFGINRN